MKRSLKNLNPLFILLFGLLMLAIQTTFLNIPSTGELQPEFILLIVIYLGLNRHEIEGVTLSFILGYLVELHSGAPRGSIQLAAVVVFIITKLLSQTIFIPSFISNMILVMSLTLVWRFIIGTCVWWTTNELDWAGHSIKFVIPAMILHGILNIPLTELLNKIDHWTGKESLRDTKKELKVN